METFNFIILFSISTGTSIWHNKPDLPSSLVVAATVEFFLNSYIHPISSSEWQNFSMLTMLLGSSRPSIFSSQVSPLPFSSLIFLLDITCIVQVYHSLSGTIVILTHCHSSSQEQSSVFTCWDCIFPSGIPNMSACILLNRSWTR